jgi:LysR family hydrogen peroxide-inducible transcriptional activator
MSSIPAHPDERDLLRFIPFDEPVPERRVVLAWRKSFPRTAAIDALVDSVRACQLNGVTMLEGHAAQAA